MKKLLINASVMAFLLAQVGCATSTRLGAAAKGGDIREVRALLNEGADVNEKGLVGTSPLYEAILYQAPFDIIQLLIDKVYRLSEAGQAQTDLASRKTAGKLLLVP